MPIPTTCRVKIRAEQVFWREMKIGFLQKMPTGDGETEVWRLVSDGKILGQIYRKPYHSKYMLQKKFFFSFLETAVEKLIILWAESPH